MDEKLKNIGQKFHVQVDNHERTQDEFVNIVLILIQYSSDLSGYFDESVERVLGALLKKLPSEAISCAFSMKSKAVLGACRICRYVLMWWYGWVCDLSSIFNASGISGLSQA